jgi:hypothetical protein
MRENGSIAGKRSNTHGHGPGHHHSSSYSSWVNMTQRCLNPNRPNFLRYGGAGIGIEDPRWLKFENFLLDMGEKPNDGRRFDIDRLDDSRGYCKENCIWLEHSEHVRLHNSKRKLRTA